MVPGSFVFVAEKLISGGEEIVALQLPAAEQSGLPSAPVPVSVLDKAGASSRQVDIKGHVGLRLPGDVWTDDVDGEPSQSATAVHAANSKRLADPLTSITRELITKCPSIMRPALTKVAKSDEGRLSLLDSLMLSNSLPIFVGAVGATLLDKNAEVKDAYDKFKTIRAEQHKSTYEASLLVAKADADPDGAFNEAEFKTQYEQQLVKRRLQTFKQHAGEPVACFNVLAEDFSPLLATVEDVWKRGTKMPGGKAFPHEHLVASFTSPALRDSVKTHWTRQQQAGVDCGIASVISEAVALSLSSKLFHTLPLRFSGYEASSPCVDGWTNALLLMLKAVPDKLKAAAALFKTEWGVDFHPWLILQGLDAVLFEASGGGQNHSRGRSVRQLSLAGVVRQADTRLFMSFCRLRVPRDRR